MTSACLDVLARACRRVWAGVLEADGFVRLHVLFFSGLWPILGAATIDRNVTTSQLSGLLLVTACFHIYTFVLNDVIDLPIDRTQAMRQRDPLVRGAIRRRHALAIALVQPLLAVPLTKWLGGGLAAQATLASGFALMGAYNLWGKRCPVPPVTDVIQGLAWGSLAVYAAQAFGATPNAMTWIVAAYATGFTLFMNGIHGGLRDLNNDLASGARTTAIFLGARPATDGGDPIVPRAVAIFASSALAGLIGIGLMLMLRNDFGYGPVVWTATTIAVGALYLLALMLLPKVVHPRGAVWDVAFRLQAYLVLMGLPVAFVAYASVKTLLVLLLLAVISVLLLEWPSVIARWYAQRCEESLRRGSSAPTTENADAEGRKGIALRQRGVIVPNKPAN